MTLRILSLAALLGLAVISEAAAACDPETWFDLESVDIQCPLSDSRTVRVAVSFAESYISPEVPESGPDPGLDRLKAIQKKKDEISFTLRPLAVDLDEQEVPGQVTLNRGEINATFTTDKAIDSFLMVLPAGTLFCDDEPVDEEVAVEIKPTDDNGSNPLVNCTENDHDASRPLDWRIDLAPADDDAEDDSGLTVEFEIDKDWGYNFKIDQEKQRWSTNLWRLQIDGSGATNDMNFYDSVKADFSWAYNRAYVADAVRKQPITAWWGSAYVRPETTFHEDDRDYVYGARLEVIANLKKLIGTNVGVGTRPYLALGFEQVDPDKREDGTAPDNYERLTGDFLWKFSPIERVRVEAGWEAKYILSDDDLAALGLDDRLQDKLEISIAYDATGGDEFLPFLKYTRGTESPSFELVDEVLFGFAWNYLFEGERPE